MKGRKSLPLSARNHNFSNLHVAHPSSARRASTPPPSARRMRPKKDRSNSSATKVVSQDLYYQKAQAVVSKASKILKEFYIPLNTYKLFQTKLEALKEIDFKAVEEPLQSAYDAYHEFYQQVKLYFDTDKISRAQQYFSFLLEQIEASISIASSAKPSSGALQQWTQSQEKILEQIALLQDQATNFNGTTVNIKKATEALKESLNGPLSNFFKFSNLDMTRRSKVKQDCQANIDKIIQFANVFPQNDANNFTLIKQLYQFLTEFQAQQGSGQVSQQHSLPVLPDVKDQPIQSLAPSKAEIQENRLKEAQKTHQQLSEQLKIAHQQEQEMNQQIKDYEDSVANYNKQVASLKLTKNEVQSIKQIKTLKEDKDKALAEIEQLKEEKSKLQEKLESLNQTIHVYDKKQEEFNLINTQVTQLKNINTATDEYISFLNNDIENSRQIEKYIVENKIQNIPNDLMNFDLKALENELNKLETNLNNKEIPDDEQTEKELYQSRLKVLKSEPLPNTFDSNIAKLKAENSELQSLIKKKAETKPNTIAVSDRSFDEAHALIGEEKSLQAKYHTLLGLVEKAKSGKISFEGSDLSIASARKMLEQMQTKYNQIEEQIGEKKNNYLQYNSKVSELEKERKAFQDAIEYGCSKQAALIDASSKAESLEIEQKILNRELTQRGIEYQRNDEVLKQYSDLFTEKLLYTKSLESLDKEFNLVFGEKIPRTTGTLAEKISVLQKSVQTPSKPKQKASKK